MSSQDIKDTQNEITMINITIYFVFVIAVLIMTAIGLLDVGSALVFIVFILLVIFGGQYINYNTYMKVLDEKELEIEKEESEKTEAEIEEEKAKLLEMTNEERQEYYRKTYFDYYYPGLSDISANFTYGSDTTGDPSGNDVSANDVSANDVSANNTTNTSNDPSSQHFQECSNGLFRWDNYIQKYDLLEHDDPPSVLPVDDDAKYLVIETTNPIEKDWYTSYEEMQKKLNDVTIGAVDADLVDGSGNLKLINQLELWENTGSDSGSGSGDNNTNNLMDNLNSIVVTSHNSSSNVPLGTQGQLINDASFNSFTSNNGFVNMNALTDGSYNTCFAFGMKEQDTEFLYDQTEKVTFEFRTAKSVNDLAMLVISTPNSLEGLTIKLLNQSKEVLYEREILTSYKQYKFKFGALIDESVIGFNTSESVTIDEAYLFKTSSRKTFAERHYSRNPDNKYDCTTETFMNSCREGYGNCNRNSSKFEPGNICRDLI